MVRPRTALTPAQIALQLDNEESEHSDEGDITSESDDDGLGTGNMSLDDDDGHEEGPVESQQTFLEPEDDPIAITPPPVSPGSQDMFLASPEPGDPGSLSAITSPVRGVQAPQPAVTMPQPAVAAPQHAVTGPAKRGRMQPFLPNSGNFFNNVVDP